MDKRIAVIGAGAIGGYTGGQLAHNGFDVTLIDPWPEHVETVRANGLELYGMTEAERCTVPLPILHLTEVQSFIRQRPIDIAFISVKSYDTEWATTMIREYRPSCRSRSRPTKPPRIARRAAYEYGDGSR